MTSGLGSLLVLVGRDPRQLVDLPVVARDAAARLDGSGGHRRRDRLGSRSAASSGSPARRPRPSCSSSTPAGASSHEEVAQLAAQAVEAGERVTTAARARPRLPPRRSRRSPICAASGRAEPAQLERLVAGAERLDETLRVAASLAARLETPLAERAGRLAEDLRGIAAREGELRRAVGDADVRALAAERRAGGRSRRGDAASRDELRTLAEALSARADAGGSGSRGCRRARAHRGTGAGRRRPGPSAPPGRARARSARRRRRAARGVAHRRRRPVRGAGARVAPRRRPRARPSSAPRCAVSAPRRSSCASTRRTPASGSPRSTSSSPAPTRSATRRSAGWLRPNAEPAEGEDRAELAEKLDRYERRREQLGQVNPLAKEEYEAEKERLQELAVQRADLEASLDELEKLRDDLTKTVETRFAETFAAVEQHFHEVAATLFPGGEGRLRMTEAEEDGEEPGIEVELRPAGKRVTRLSLLSGGEKALGAIAFLFSLFLARPSPFYLLDEVEAALDDTNIGRFTELLRTYADRAQFIVITHQKRTMEAADVLYGVTMGADGVSQIVSRRLPRDDVAAATA